VRENNAAGELHIASGLGAAIIFEDDLELFALPPIT